MVASDKASTDSTPSSKPSVITDSTPSSKPSVITDSTPSSKPSVISDSPQIVHIKDKTNKKYLDYKYIEKYQ